MRVELCGGIGAGKTTLTRRLASELQLEPVCENYSEVPYWKEFCLNRNYEFEKNMGFLLAYGDLLHKSSSVDRICDFSLVQAGAFVAICTDKRARDPLRSTLDFLTKREGPPDLIIKVKCSIGEQMTRIHERGREAEREIGQRYLRKLDRSIDREANTFCKKHKVPFFGYDSEARIERRHSSSLDGLGSVLNKDSSAS